MRLLLFNPETEYALASGASFYTPPFRVERMRQERQLLPEAWAQPEDIIIVDDPTEFKSVVRLVAWHELADLFDELPELTVEPWGWNPALIRRFKDCGVPADKLPDETAMNLIRRLAHRRTTIRLNSFWNSMVEPTFKVELPMELHSIDECMEFHRRHPGCWMKAPWSSSGRGVINTASDMSEVLVEQWCRGILRRQGSVMGETGADRTADFATEWRIGNGEPCFLGLSIFSTSSRGKYISNASISQQEMRLRFDAISNIPIDEVVGLQKDILREVLTGYEGLCGVDMLIERTGCLRPFVELNLRRTMGMLHCNQSAPDIQSGKNQK